MEKLDAFTLALVEERNFATVATLNPDGSPQTSVVWIGRRGDTIVFSTTSDRQKARNITRDPRVSVSIYDHANPYHAVEIRGLAELLDDPTRSLSRELSLKYLDEDPPPEPETVRRLIVRIVPQKITRFAA